MAHDDVVIGIIIIGSLGSDNNLIIIEFNAIVPQGAIPQIEVFSCVKYLISIKIES